MSAQEDTRSCLRGARISVAMVAGIGLVMAIALFILSSHHCVAEEQHPAASPHRGHAWQARGMLLSSLALTGTLTFYFLTSIEYARRMARLAARLKQANESLGGEIAARGRTAEAMARESAKLSTMIAGMEEGVVFADAEDRIVEVNEYFLRFMHRQRSDLVGHPILDVHPAPMRRRVQEILDGFRVRTESTPHVVQRRMGALEFILRIQPIYRDGAYDGALLNLIDVTELVAARRAAESANRGLAATNAELREQVAAYATAAGYALPSEPHRAVHAVSPAVDG